jgi:hypothetical protein
MLVVEALLRNHMPACGVLLLLKLLRYNLRSMAYLHIAYYHELCLDQEFAVETWSAIGKTTAQA